MKEIDEHPKVSIVLPCLNEKEALALCLEEIHTVIKKEGLDAEIILVDNGSTDGSEAIALGMKKDIPELTVLTEEKKGYGSAYMKGLRQARGRFIFMADADYSYDFAAIPQFIAALEKGSDVVIGNRFSGEMESGAMPWHHRYFGNPVISFVVRKFFGIKINDTLCGARAMKKEAFETMDLRTRGMEFASEMIIQAAKRGLTVSEIPIRYRVRKGHSKLESFGDGWRYIRFALLYSPIYLFFIPGIILFIVGALSLAMLYFFTPRIFGIDLYVHPMFLSSMLIIMGYQVIFFGGFARIYATTHLGETDTFLQSLFKKITIERAGLAGIIIGAVGALIYLFIAVKWVRSGFGSLNEIKNSVVALTFVVLGIQTFFSAFMLSIIGIQSI